jgi:hypothetical protein
MGGSSMKRKADSNNREILYVSRKVYRRIQSVMSFSREEKREFIISLLSRFSEEEQERWFVWIRNYVHPEMKWANVERWMERQFISDRELKPVRVASMAVAIFKINKSMRPFFIKMAQRVSNRVRMREVRAKKKAP